MAITEIYYQKGRKVGLPNYSSVDVHAGVRVSIDSEKDMPAAIAEAKKLAHTIIADELAQYTITPNTVQRT